MPSQKRICNEIIKSGPNKGFKCYEVTQYCRNQQHREKINNIIGNNNHNNIKESFNNNNSNNNSINSINSNNSNKIINNIFCVGSHDDFRKILIEKMGEQEAKEYILKCAKNNLQGDLNMLNKIYFEGKEYRDYPIKLLDKKRQKVEYINESGDIIIDSNGLKIGKLLSCGLQNSYLFYVTQIIEDNLNQQDDGRFLDEFEIYNCQTHVYNLSNRKYQRQIIKHLPNDIF